MRCVLALVLATIASAQEWTPVPLAPQDGLAAEVWRDALAAAREQPSPENARAALYAAALALGDRGSLRAYGDQGLALELGVAGEHARNARPSVLVTTSRAGAPRSEALLWLDWLERSLAAVKAGDDLVEATTWCFVAPPLPGDGLVHPGHDFPLGWNPAAPVHTGDVPLSHVSTRALAALLTGPQPPAGVLIAGGEGPSAGGLGAYTRALGLTTVTTGQHDAAARLVRVTVTVVESTPLSRDTWRVELILEDEGMGDIGGVVLRIKGADLILAQDRGRSLGVEGGAVRVTSLGAARRRRIVLLLLGDGEAILDAIPDRGRAAREVSLAR